MGYAFEESRPLAGSVLQRQGEQPQSVWVVASGEVRVQVRGDAHARPLHLALCGPGMLVGELRAGSAECACTLVVASAGVKLLSLSREKFFAQLDGQASTIVEEAFAMQLRA